MPKTSPLGREVQFPQHYAPDLLFPIERAQARAEIGVHADTRPFIGVDRWHAYELSWLDARGKPVVMTATISVPASSPCLLESKSLKLYLNSLNAHTFASPEAARRVIAGDLARVAGAKVTVEFGLPPAEAAHAAILLDDLELEISHYAPPAPVFLHASDAGMAEETLCSQLFKSNCPVTGQPDWASVQIAYCGPRIDHAGLLRYLMSFREHADFHEHCVERMFTDLMARCRPQRLSVEARYTRRGGLDINPWRATPGHAPPVFARDVRQ